MEYNVMSEYFRKYIKSENYPLHPSSIAFKTHFTNCVREVLAYRGYAETEDDQWNIFWCEKEQIPEALSTIKNHERKVNHFRNYYQICRKDLLYRNIKRQRRKLEKEGNVEEALQYNYTPLTFNLPNEYSIFLEEYKRNKGCNWIMKPIGKSQGKGIFIFQRLGEIANWADPSTQTEPYIVQKYIHNPLLVGNKKFDLRIYVLVVSHNPLTIYLYRSGFGRFTHYRYEESEIDSLQGHLTNVAIQKVTDQYDEQKGGKYQLDRLRLYLVSRYGREPIEECFHKIQEIIIRTLIATSQLMVTDKRSFELYGFDVMIDQNLKPWLLEINGSPSYTATTFADKCLKRGLLDDALTVVNLQDMQLCSYGRLTGNEEQVGGFDLIYKQPKRYTKWERKISLLGCFNNRKEQLRKLAKETAIRMLERARKREDEQKQRAFSRIEPERRKNIFSEQQNKIKGIDVRFPKVASLENKKCA